MFQWDPRGVVDRAFPPGHFGHELKYYLCGVRYGFLEKRHTTNQVAHIPTRFGPNGVVYLAVDEANNGVG